MSGIKIVLLFLVSPIPFSLYFMYFHVQFMFSVGQLILILPPDNNEFGPTILIAFIVVFIAFPVIHIIVSPINNSLALIIHLQITYELRVGYCGIFIIGFLLMVYCIFKIYR